MIKVYWETGQANVVRLDYSDPVVDWEEYNTAVRQSLELARSQAPLTVHLLHNPGSTRMPKGNAFVHIRRAMLTAPANTGLIVMVITDVFAKNVIEVLLRLVMRQDARFARSLDEAHAIIDLWHEVKQSTKVGSN
jgi:hypothetical protein